MGRKKQMKTENVELDTSLSVYTAAKIHSQLAEVYKNSDRIEIDLKNITDCDTAGIQLLFSLKKSCLDAGKEIFLKNPSEAVNDALNRISISWETLDC